MNVHSLHHHLLVTLVLAAELARALDGPTATPDVYGPELVRRKKSETQGDVEAYTSSIGKDVKKSYRKSTKGMTSSQIAMVVGLCFLAVAIIILIIWLVLRNRRKKKMEEQEQRGGYGAYEEDY